MVIANSASTKTGVSKWIRENIQSPFSHKKAQKHKVINQKVFVFLCRFVANLIAMNESVHISFRNTETEYMAATRFYYLHSRELVTRLIVTFVLFAVGLVVLFPLILDYSLPIPVSLFLLGIVGAGWFHRAVIDLPRRHFRGDPKFRDEYHLTFSDAGIQFQTLNMSSMIAWNFYTGVIENDKFYLMKYGHYIHSVSIVPKRAFKDSGQETTFRQMLRRNLDPRLKLSEGERENQEYIPKNLQPPDWR
jgi:hypothetical protein